MFTPNFADISFASGPFSPTTQSDFSDLMTIRGDSGNVGIGTTAPTNALQVWGDIRVGNSGTNGCVQQFAGTALTGTCASDERLKKNIKPLAPVLARLSLIQAATYEWRVEDFPTRHFGPGVQLGVIAQQVQRVMPELVTIDQEGFLRVHFSDLPIYLLAGISELKAEKDREIEQLKARAAKAEADVEQLKATVCTDHAQAPFCR